MIYVLLIFHDLCLMCSENWVNFEIFLLKIVSRSFLVFFDLSYFIHGKPFPALYFFVDLFHLYRFYQVSVTFGYQFNPYFLLDEQICVTSSTSAGLEQILPWMFYHKVIGVTNFFLFVEGKAATPEVSKVLESIPVSRHKLRMHWFYSSENCFWLN